MKTKDRVKSKALAEFLANLKPIPGFDCLELKRLGHERLRSELDGLTARQGG